MLFNAFTCSIMPEFVVPFLAPHTQVSFFVLCGLFRYVEERSFRRFVEACLEETVVVYVDHLLSQVLLEKIYYMFHLFDIL